MELDIRTGEVEFTEEEIAELREEYEFMRLIMAFSSWGAGGKAGQNPLTPRWWHRDSDGQN